MGPDQVPLQLLYKCNPRTELPQTSSTNFLYLTIKRKWQPGSYCFSLNTLQYMGSNNGRRSGTLVNQMYARERRKSTTICSVRTRQIKKQNHKQTGIRNGLFLIISNLNTTEQHLNQPSYHVC